MEVWQALTDVVLCQCSINQSIMTTTTTGPATRAARRRRLRSHTHPQAREIRSLLRTLRDHGFALDGVHDGDALVPGSTEAGAMEAITSVDMSRLAVRHSNHPGRLWLLLVLGNEPGELVADHADHVILSLAVEAFACRWVS
jgi:hypothetical protein